MEGVQSGGGDQTVHKTLPGSVWGMGCRVCEALRSVGVWVVSVVLGLRVLGGGGSRGCQG